MGARVLPDETRRARACSPCCVGDPWRARPAGHRQCGCAGVVPRGLLPIEASRSDEADLAAVDDPHDAKADLIDGAIGELSLFHDTFGYYAQGVSVSTAVLPDGWRDRIVLFETPGTMPGRGLCLEPHDCVVSKLVAGREKDVAFAGALLREHLIDSNVLLTRIQQLRDVDDTTIDRLRTWVATQRDADIRQ